MVSTLIISVGRFGKPSFLGLCELQGFGDIEG